MSHRSLFHFLSYSIIASLILQPLLFTLQMGIPSDATLPFGVESGVAFAQSDANGQNATNSVYLPLVQSAGSVTTAPQFEISAPLNNGSVAGTFIFAIQPTGDVTINNVSFKAGSTLLGTDSTAADGFKVFVDAKILAAGPTQFSATANSAAGSTTKSVSVNVVSNPPASATIGTGSAVLATSIGSVIGFQPDSLPAGATVTVTELSQEQVTEQTGIRWDDIGVTFLGAQFVDSTAPISRPFASVSSAGFANRIQPGQAVVNYRLQPDADGDGVSEIVVVNTASAAPNGDVVADPVNRPTVQSVSVFSADHVVAADTLSAEIAGLPGTLIQFKAAGFNPLSLTGNLAIYQSLVDGTTQETPVSIQPDSQNQNEQVLSSVIPILPAGLATVRFSNSSSALTTEVFTLTIQALPTPSLPAQQIIDNLLSQSKSQLAQITSGGTITDSQMSQLLTQSESQIEQVQAQITETFTSIAQIPSQSDREAALQQMEQVAAFIDVMNASYAMRAATVNVAAEEACDPNLQNDLDKIKELADVIGNVGKGLKYAGLLVGLFNPVVGRLMGVAATSLSYSSKAMKAATFMASTFAKYNCPPPRRCQPTQTPNGPTGMGGAPPPGGNSCGGASGGGAGSIFQAAGMAGEQSLADQIVIKIYINGKATPFSGLVDAGGYFFIPLLPEGEPYTAIAYDRVSGQTRTVNGVGPKTGDSTYMFFDFDVGEDASNVTWDGGGDGTSWSDPKNWRGDSVPVDINRVTIDDALGHTILITDDVDVLAIQSAAPIELGDNSSLLLHNPSLLNNGLTFDSGSYFIVQSSLQISNGLTLPPGAGLIAEGASAKITVQGEPTLSGGDLYAVDGGQILLPQATTYNGDIRSLSYDSYFLNPFTTLYERLELCKSSIMGGNYARICAVGSGSHIDLSGLFALDGETWTGFFGAVAYLGIRAAEGGVVDLSNLEAISKGRIAALSRDAGSQVNLGKLQNPGERSYFLSAEQGWLNIGSLNNLYSATLDISKSDQISTSQITNLENAIVYVDQVTPDFSQVDDIKGASLHATGGGKIILPKITTYWSDGRDFFTTVDATGAGSLVDLANTNVLTGNTFVNDQLTIAASDGGTIKLGSVTSITLGKVCFKATGSGSLIDLSALTQFTLLNDRGSSCLNAESKGAIDLKNHGLTVEGSPTWSDIAVSLQSGGVITLASLSLNPATSLSAMGVFAGNLTNHSTVAPGTSVTKLQINGTYTQASDGVLAIELKGKVAGALFDQLNVRDAATLAGHLNLDFIEGYKPLIGDTFEILKAGSLTGSFEGVDVTGLDGSGKKAEVTYTATSVVIKIVAG